jgi:hypothetical protein
MLRALWLVLLFAVVGPASAQPAPADTTVYYTFENSANNSRLWTSADFPTAAALCASLPATGTYYWGAGSDTVNSLSYSSFWSSVSAPPGACTWQRFTHAAFCSAETPNCNSNGNRTYPMASKVVKQCPGGAEVIGSGSSATCACPSGRTWNETEGQCLGCGAGSVVSSGYYEIGPDPSVRPKILSCESGGDAAGCEAVFDGISPAGSVVVNGVKQWYAQGSYIRTGNSCQSHGEPSETPTGDDATPEESCAPGQARGEINGQPVCVDQGTGEESGDSKGKATEETTSTTETLPDGSIRETTKTTICDASGNCSETTTVKTTGTDGSQTITKETVPTAGNGAPGASTGDPDPDEEDPARCEEGDQSVGCAELGDPPASEDVTNENRTLTFGPASGFSHASTCPADKVVQLAHVTLTFPFTLLCDAADMARPIVLAVAWLSAAFVFVGIARKEG